jgi:hypothetical protein
MATKRRLDGIEIAKQSSGVPTYIGDAFTLYAVTTTAADLLKKSEGINSCESGGAHVSNQLGITRRSSAVELAAPLDLLLTSSAVGVAERMMPNVAWSRFALNRGSHER